jgi:hypothetical protein
LRVEPDLFRRPSDPRKDRFRGRPFQRRAVQSISSGDGEKTAFKRKESSMTRHIESYRYEILHGDDADFVTYQRKSSDGNWQTISTWMIPDPADY